MRQLLRRAWCLLRHRRLDADLSEEFEFHRMMKQRELEARGVDPSHAALASRRTLGNVTLAREDARAVWIWPWLDSAWQDAAYALRSLRRQPGFTAVAVLTLGLGIGANTAIFSVIDTLLLRPPIFPHPDRLVSLQDSNPQRLPFDTNPSPGNFLDWRERSHSLDHLIAWRNWYFTLANVRSDAKASESVRGVSVSPTFFSMLGIRPAIGRAFQPDEEQPGKNRVVILSDGLWKRRFGADRAIVGRAVLIDGSMFSVVGVLPHDFQFFQPDLDLWMPLTVDAALHDRQNHSVAVFGSLAPNVSLAQAQAEMDAIARSLADSYPDGEGGWAVKVRSLYPTPEVRELRPALLVLSGAASLVLLIACANVANLLLARATTRHKEIGVRAALGASRARLIRQMLTESIVLAIGSGVAGAIVSYQGITLLVPLLPHAGTNQAVSSFRAVSPVLDTRMLGFSIVIAVLTGIIFGLIPAFQTTRSESLRLWSLSAHKPRAGRMLMIAELGLSIVLLTGAGLLVKSFWNLQHVDPGFRSDHLLTMQVWLPKTKYPGASDIRAFYDEVIRRVGTVPGVAGASAISYRPFLGMGVGGYLEIEGRAARSGDQPVAGYRVVTPGFLRIIGQTLMEGRDFTDHDSQDAEGVAIINEAMARQYWPGGHAIGRRVRPDFHRSTVPWEINAEPRWLTVVGVVRNIKGFNQVNEVEEKQVYVSFRQVPFSFMYLVVRTATPPLGVAAAVQAQIRAVDPDQPVSDIRTMDDAISAYVPRFNVELLAAFAMVALILAAVGVYGVSSYGVNARTQEIGIRMALGAESRDVLLMVLREGLGLGLIGVCLGLIASLAFTRAMSGILYGVAPTDLPAYIGAASILLAVVLVACYVPARRAARLDPAITLRA